MRKQLYTILLFTFFLLFSLNGISQIVVSEIISSSQVEIQNQGSDTVNVDQFWFCNRPTYDRIGSLNAVCGNFNMPPGSFLVVTTSQVQLASEGAELGIYSSGDFTDSQSIMDYLIWGDKGPSTRESVAVAAGIWTADDRAPSYDDDNSLLYDGDGDSGSDFYLGLSNQCAINIDPCEVSGGDLSIEGGATTIEICAGDGVSDAFGVQLDSASGTNMSWVITDTTGMILALPLAPPFDLDSSGAGVCLIWNISYEDDLTGLAIGSSKDSVGGCFAFSNAIVVTRVTGEDCQAPPCEVSGGDLSIEGGATTIEICAGDGVSDAFGVQLDSASGTNMSWVITDTIGMILALPLAPPFDLDSSGAGVCLIWNISYEDDLTGLAIGSSKDSVGGCFAFSNAIVVTRVTGEDCQAPPCEVSGGDLSIEGGATTIEICAGDGVSDAFGVQLDSASGTNMSWVITDTTGMILALPLTPPFDLDSSGAGVCLIWNISYEGDLAGLSIGSSKDSVGGCFAFSNAIEVTRLTGEDCPVTQCDVSGGSITAQELMTEVTICVDDNDEELVIISLSGAVGTNSAYLVTDTSGNILAIETNTSVFSFESSAAGTVLIRHLSFDLDLVGLAIGANTSNLSGCFSLSNTVQITKLAGEDCSPQACEVSGGDLSIEGGATTIEICAGDGVSDAFGVQLDNSSGTNMSWVITDTTGTILALPLAPPFDLDSSGAGVCLIWNVSYEGDLTGLAIGSSKDSVGGCFAFSNSIEVTRLTGEDCPVTICEVSGGSITAQDLMTEVTICVDDNDEELVIISLSGAVGTNTAYLVTDTSGNILAIETNTSVFSFESSAAGTVLIWHLSFEDGLEGMVIGANTSNLSGCFSLSNTVQITKLAGEDCQAPPCEVSGGDLSIEGGATTIEICAGDGVSDAFGVQLDSASGTNMSWVITDTTGMILALPLAPPFDLDSSGAGVCLIWNISYEGDLAGLSIGSSKDSVGGCFAFSNAIVVTRVTGEDCQAPPCEVSGGDLSIEGGATTIEICAGDGVSDAFGVQLDSASGTNMSWVITDTTGMILALPLAPPFDLDSSGAGVCLIWNVSYEGDLAGLAIGSSKDSVGGCFAFSNAIVVTRVTGEDCQAPPCEVSGGDLSIEGGSTTIEICAGDGVSDAFGVQLDSASGTNMSWVITDTSGMILALPLAPPFDLDSSGAGVCLIWNISYEGDLAGLAIGSSKDSVGGCFAFSNAIVVTRVTGEDCQAPPCEVSGGDLSIEGGSTTIEICAGDGVSDAFGVQLDSASGTNMSWVITDTSGMILALPLAPPFDLDSSGAGVCLIWNISYEGDLAGLAIGSSKDSVGGCFAFSNAIVVTRVTGEDCPSSECDVSGGTIVTQDSLTAVIICVDDDNEELVVVSLDGSIGTNQAFVVTDTSGNIIAIETNTNVFSFESLGPGICLIWHISFEDDLVGADVGGNTSNFSGCFDLSESIVVTRLAGEDCQATSCDVNGGAIMTQDSLTDITICVDDEAADIIEVSLSGAGGSQSIWIVTDTNNTILSVDTSNVFDLEGNGAGICLIWHISYDSLAGAEVESSVAGLTGCFAISNSITVTKIAGNDCTMSTCDADGGNLLTEFGNSEIVVCGGGESTAPFDVILEGAVGTRSAWVITDSEGIILGFPLAPPFNLSGARPGVYMIWHLTYDGAINGASLGSNLESLNGCFALSNSINVTRVDISPGVISFEGGEESVQVCIANDVSEVIGVVISGEEGPNTQWAITDADGFILDLPDSSSLNLANIESGLCLVWAVTHGGDISGLEIGASFEDLRGCYVLSNSISIHKSSVDGGNISTEIGSTDIIICVGDQNEEPLGLFLSGSHGDNSAFFITDTSGTIIEIAGGLDDLVIDDLGAGICHLWHISYNDSIVGLENGSNVSDIGGCYDLSNSVTLSKVSGEDCPPPCTAEGGILSLPDGSMEITLCVDDGVSDAFELTVNGASGENLAYIVADESGNIIGLEDSFSADFETTGEGLIFVRHIAFNDNANIPDIGGNINMLTGCYSLSNIFTINRVINDQCEGICTAEGGEISSDFGQEISICLDDEISDVIDVSVSGNSGDQNIFVITDASSNILMFTNEGSIDFAGSGSGTCFIWHLSYNDSLGGLMEGSSIMDIDGCYDFSNSISVTRVTDDECPDQCNTDGGIVMSTNGETALDFCAGEVSFTITHESAGTDASSSYWYVITNEDGVILDWRNSSEGGDFNLNRNPPGTCLIYGYETLDASLLEEGIHISELAVDCGSISSNFVTVTKEAGGQCDEGCHRPRDVRIKREGQNRWSVKWDRVTEATGYIVRIGFEGLPNSFSNISLSRNKVVLSGPSSRIMVLQIKAVCGQNESSEFTELIRLADENTASSAFGRSAIIHHGTVLPSGIIVTEQAMAFPNPAIDNISIWYDGEGVEGQLSMFDRMGRRILTKTLSGNQELHQMSIENLENGLYFMMIESNGSLLMQDKIIKSNGK